MSIIKKLFKAGNVSTQIDGSGHKRGKIKLVAIAKDEAFYFPEWVHHHLYFGFDEIDIYINRTTDNSVEVLDSISSIYPQVSWFSADWIDKCPQDAKKQIQFIVYNKVWDEALREGGYSHIFFLDIDEFWIPKSFDLTIHQFLDNYSQSDVISFEWLNDLGDLNAFSELPINIKGNLSPLVKTLYPIDTPIVELRHHVGLLESNAKHILVDGALFKPRQSLIQAVHEDLQSLKAAFIYHRAHRSIEEYISLLYRGRPGETFPYKTNRHGLPTPDAWYQEVALPEDAYFQYTASLNRFKEEIDFSNISKAAKQFVLTRFNESMANLKEYVAQDYPVMMQMFRGVFHQEVVSVFSQQRARMVEESPSDFRLIRDLAIDAASQSIDEAITLMEKAHILNPTGPLINKKLDEFKRIATSQQAK